MSPVYSRLKAEEIERAITAFARSPNGGLILTPNAAAMPAHYSVIVRLAARYKLPAVYPFPEMVTNGGLMSYGPDVVDQSRHAAEYVDRPGELPVQQATKYELRINLKTAKALGLDIPNSLHRTRGRGDRVVGPMSAFGT